MFIKQAIELNTDEIIELAEIVRIGYNHEYLSRMPTVLKATIDTYIQKEDGEQIVITERQAEQNILKNLNEKGWINDTNDWRVDITAHHRFSAYDEDGYAHSIYTAKAEVYKKYHVTINDEKRNPS